MIYTVILDEGIVLDENGVQIAPCQSAEEQGFIDYNNWIAAGNSPIVLDTRG